MALILYSQNLSSMWWVFHQVIMDASKKTTVQQFDIISETYEALLQKYNLSILQLGGYKTLRLTC